MKETRLGKSLPTALVLGLCSVWAMFSGYWRIFSEFAPYDDEGYLMMTVRQVADGSVLYDQVYTQYGPAYYLYKSLLVQVLAIPLTHDATRLSTLVMWVLMACVAGILVNRLTRSAVFAGIGFIVSFYVLSRTVFEPGHPQEVAGLVTLLVLLALFIDHRTVRYCLVAVLLAILCLIKINLGVFLGTAIGVAILCAAHFGYRSRPIKVALFILALASANLMFFRFRDSGWNLFGMSIAIALTSAGILGFQLRTGDERIPVAKTFLFLSLIAMLILGIQMSMGSSVTGMLEGVLFQHLKFGGDFVQPAPVRLVTLAWAFIGLFIVDWVRKNKISAKWLTLLKLSFGFAIIAAALLDNSYNTNTFIVLNFGVPFVWLGLLSEDEEKYLPRLGLVFAAVLTTLQVFPITGTQMSYGTMLCALVGVVCASDAVKGAGHVMSLPWIKPVLTAAIAAGVLVAAFWFTALARRTYLANTPLELPGAARVRLPAEQVEVFRGLTERLRSECETFLTMPGLYSLYFWAEKEPPTTLNTTAWMSLLDERQQTEIVETAKPIDRLCVVYNPEWTAAGSRNRDLSQSPLANYIFSSFVTTNTFGEYQFMQRK